MSSENCFTLLSALNVSHPELQKVVYIQYSLTKQYTSCINIIYMYKVTTGTDVKLVHITTFWRHLKPTGVLSEMIFQLISEFDK